MNGIFIAVEGPTGAGKTTLAAQLAAALPAHAVLDPFDANPFFRELAMTDNPKVGLALRTELTFLALRVAQLREVAEQLDAGRCVVADWALLKQAIFATTTLQPDDAARLAATITVWAASVPTQDVLIGLTASPVTLRTRVRHRGRDVEARLSIAQLAALSAAFDNAFASWPGRFIRLDTDTFDAFDEQHVTELADRIRQLVTSLELR
jgi:deoxyadenosine/deoxycytidine kinase